MSTVSLESNERISRRFFDIVIKLVEELEGEGDQEALKALPTVMLTTGLMSMCQNMSLDTVLTVMDALKVKVERGDFSSGRDTAEY